MKQSSRTKLISIAVGGILAASAGMAVATDVADKPMISPKAMADALHLVMDSDRTVYTRKIVNRLVKKEKVIKASEHYDDEKALVLPAQMFRYGSELVSKRGMDNRRSARRLPNAACRESVAYSNPIQPALVAP